MAFYSMKRRKTISLSSQLYCKISFTLRVIKLMCRSLFIMKFIIDLIMLGVFIRQCFHVGFKTPKDEYKGNESEFRVVRRVFILTL
jgi:hypothetical protein